MEQYPYYLSIGMSASEYWDADAGFAKCYREADKLRQERKNTEAWLQGMYVYDAIQRLVPILTAFPKKGAKAQEYMSEPYPITRQERESAEENREKRKAERAKAKIEAFMRRHNQKMQNNKE